MLYETQRGSPTRFLDAAVDLSSSCKSHISHAAYAAAIAVFCAHFCRFCARASRLRLLFIAVVMLQFSVWSIGVCESHSKEFFVRETLGLKTCYSPRSEYQEYSKEYHIDQHSVQKHLEKFEFTQEEELDKTQPPPVTLTSAAHLTLTLLLLAKEDGGSQQSESPAAAALF